MEPLKLTPKQAEYVREAHHRWNFAVGAVRSGKSHLAITYTIPNRLLAGHGKKGLNVILSSSFGNVSRNVIEPMRAIWGKDIVGRFKGQNLINIAGENVLCFGAEKRNAVARLRGSEVKFCYIDEVCDVHVESFEMLKSRLSLPYSECHAACNPAHPQHYIKRFLDTEANGVDIFNQHYTIYDNPFLPPDYVSSLEAEYAGTVYYKRYIEGLWTQAEGLVYPMFESAYEEPYEGDVLEYCVSCDYGTQNPFAAILWGRDPQGVWHAVKEYYYSGRGEGHQKTDQDYVFDMIAFSEGLPDDVSFIVDPSAASFIAAMRRAGKRVLKADNAVLDGIRDTAVCMQLGYIKLGSNCKFLEKELGGYCWDDKTYCDKPIKENDHACDAMRYFVRTKRVYRPKHEYKSPFVNRSR